MEKVIAEFGINADGVIAQAKKAKEELDKLIQTNKDLRKDGEASSETFIENEAKIKALRAEYNGYVRTLQRSEQHTKTNANATDLLNIALNAEVNTIEQLRENNRMLNELRNRTNIETEEGRDQLRLLNNRLDENNAKIKDNVDSYTQQKIGIGDYTGGIKEAILSTDLFGDSIAEINQSFKMFAPLTSLAMNFIKGWSSETGKATKATQAQNKATSMSVVSVQALSGAFKLLRVAIASTGIGLLVITLGSLVSYLTTTQSGINAVSRVTKPLTEVFKSLFEFIQNIGKAVFDNPLKSLTNIYDVVKNKLIGQFKILGKILHGLVTLDFDKMREGWQEQKDWADDGAESFKNAWNAFSDGAKEAWQRGKEIQQLNEAISEMEIKLIEDAENYTDAIKEQEKVMQDRTKSAKEREEAAERILQITKEQIKQEKLLAEAELERLKKTTEAGELSYEDRKEIANAESKIRQIARKEDEEEIKQLRIKAQVHNENNRNIQKALDDEIKKMEDIQKLRSAEVGNLKLGSAERLELLDKEFKESEKIQSRKLELGKISEHEYNLFLIDSANERGKLLNEIAIEQAEKENETAIREIEKQYKERKRITEEEYQNRLEHRAELNEKENELDLIKLKNNDLTKEEFAKREIERERKTLYLIDELKKERAEQDKAERLEIEEIDEAERLEKLRKSLWNEYEFKAHELESINEREQADLLARLEAGEISRELYEARYTDLQNKYERQRFENSKAIIKQEVDLYKNMADNIAGVLGNQSRIGQAFAIAQATWNTYEGITQALKAPTLPSRIAQVAYAAKTGFDAVKNIKSSSKGNVSTSIASGASEQQPNINFTDTGAVIGRIDGSNADYTEAIKEAVREGSEQGTRRGNRENLIDENINNITSL